MAIDLERVESSLARYAKDYLSCRRPELRVQVSSDLAFVLQWHWQQRGLSPPRWFDGLLLERTTFKPRKSSRLDIRGLMTWAEEGTDGRQWIDLFSADLRVDEGREVMAEYVLRFGRKGAEDRKVPYAALGPLQEDLTVSGSWEWAYVFRKYDPKV